jgi:hypothetical protein
MYKQYKIYWVWKPFLGTYSLSKIAVERSSSQKPYKNLEEARQACNEDNDK